MTEAAQPMQPPTPPSYSVPLPPTHTPSASTSSDRSRIIPTPTPPLQQNQDRDNSSPKGDEVGLLRHQLRLSRAEVLSLQQKLGIRPNPAPFGSTLRKQSSEANPHASLSPPIRSHGRSSSPDPTNRSPSPSSPKSPKAGSGPLPGAVSFTKALLSEDGLPTNPENSGLDQNGSSSMSTSRSNGGSSGPRAAENPFFGSAGSSRERLSKSAVSASSGSGKVISGLQSELLARSSALDTARQQLRVSQRAVEFLTRQNEDLTESKDRLSTENEQLTKTINRKERLQSESTSRALLAETSLSALQKSHQEAVSTHNARLKEAEDKAEEAEGARWKAESEYGSLREGMKSMAEGWKADLDWLKEDLKKLQEKHGRELDEAKLKHMALTKLFKAKEAEHVDVKSTINIIQASLKTTERTIAELSERFEGSSTGVAFANDEEALRRCQELEGEFRRLRRLMRDHT